MMDTSKEYIEMCSQTLEIQEKWVDVTAGDFVALISLNPDDPVHCYGDLDADEFKGFKKDNPDYNPRHDGTYRVWLPRQDQLQEMALFQDPIPHTLHALKEFSLKHEYCKTLEQLWLSFIMMDCYNKQWDGEEWNT